MFWLGAIVSLCYVPGLVGQFIATQWPVLSILLPLALWRPGPVTAFHWAGLLFLAYATVRLWYAPIFDDAVYGLWLICIMAGSFWLGSTLDSLRKLYMGLAVGASASSAVAIFQAFGFVPVLTATVPPSGLFFNSVAQGIVLALIAVALVSERLWLWALPLVPGIVLSGSRGAWLALAVGLLSIYVRRAWVFAIVGAAGVFMLWLHPLSSSDAQRLFIWNEARLMLTWSGWGPGTFFSWLLPWNGNSLYPEYAHNDALQLMFEYGIAAAVPIGIFAFALTRTKAREWPVIVAFVAASCYSMPLWVPVTSFLACVAAGRLVRDWALHGRNCYDRGCNVVSWRRYWSSTGSDIVSVEPRYQARG